jgi:hypothetical protein
MAAAMIGEEARQHLGEAEDGIHRRAIRPGHRRQGVEGAEDVAGAVDQDEVLRPGRGDRHRLGRGGRLGQGLAARPTRPAVLGSGGVVGQLGRRRAGLSGGRRHPPRPSAHR